MIVVEGADNSGKSTLIKALLVVLPGWDVQGSEGPPKFPGEMNERVRRYLGRGRTLFDRHPCVSQPIYGQMRTHKDEIDPALIKSFYDQAPLFIYCHGRNNMTGHQFNPETDSAEHLAAVENNYAMLLDGYTTWAAEHAFLSYRIGDSVSRVVKSVEFLVRNNKA
jgi:hypothetical protein